ncbi:hypothetical protein GCM10025787_00150 [Saccharopolyspora rosea]|uniref:DUF3137 domain-containing protein n=1 Tax=Saccharopolyspora rosea TaxID=524884 RepID=A0ABW3FNK1_9PSEU
MSMGLAVAIVVGGCLVVAAAIVVLVVWLNRLKTSEEKAVLERLHARAAELGWTYEERNDSYVSVYNAQREYMTQPLLAMPTRRNPLAPFQPYHRPSKAVAAKKIVTGVHRGRSFIAALFTVNYANEQSSVRVIWVRTPAAGPALTVSREARVASHINKAIGQGDVQLGNVEFDEQFEISQEDESFTRTVLNPAVIEYLLNTPRKFQSMSFLADHIDFSDQVTDHRDPEQLIPALDLRCDVLDRVPQSAWT